MTDRKLAVKFENKSGKYLFGIMHEPPEASATLPAVILLSPGIKSRVAPHRLYVDIAKSLSNLGFLVLRFDFEGLGDSEGQFAEELAEDLYAQVQKGRLVGDVYSAMDMVATRYGSEKFILMGLCGGAITGVLAAADDLRVDAVVGIGTPVIMSGTKYRSAEFLTQGELKQFRRGYLRRLFSLEAWVRLLTFKTDYKTLIRSVFVPKWGQPSSPKTNPNGQSLAPRMDVSDNLNTLFPSAMNRIVESSRSVFLVFGENDRLRWEFEEKYLPRVDGGLSSLPGVEVYISPKARHVFEFPEQKIDLIDRIAVWVSSRYLCPVEHTRGRVNAVG